MHKHSCAAACVYVCVYGYVCNCACVHMCETWHYDCENQKLLSLPFSDIKQT